METRRLSKFNSIKCRHVLYPHTKRRNRYLITAEHTNLSVKERVSEPRVVDDDDVGSARMHDGKAKKS